MHKKCPKPTTVTVIEHNRELLNKIKGGEVK